MSRTTTAAETRARGTPSFDRMWANLPEELSPSSSHRGDSFFCEEDRVNVNELCRNTFVHLESSSPLARMSVAELVKSFKEFSSQINTQTESLTPLISGPGPDHTCYSKVADTDAYRRQETLPSTPASQMRPIFLSSWKDGTPETGIETPQSETPNLLATVYERGSICDFVTKYKENLKASKESPTDLVLLNQTPISQALLSSTAKKDTPSDQKDTATIREGSTDVYREGHPYTCKPCAFYWSKGCLNGDKCLFCHLWHVPKRKKPMREQRNLMIIAKDDGKITFLRCSIKDVM